MLNSLYPIIHTEANKCFILFSLDFYSIIHTEANKCFILFSLNFYSITYTEANKCLTHIPNINTYITLL